LDRFDILRIPERGRASHGKSQSCFHDLLFYPLDPDRHFFVWTIWAAELRQKGFPWFSHKNQGWFNHDGCTLWLFNIAMENGPFIVSCPIEHGDFP
jgi:hypothetical protein